MAQLGLVQVATNRDLARREQEKKPAQAQPVPLTQLAGHVERAWQAAQTAKQPIERQMFRALRQRQGIYEPEDLARIRAEGGSEIYMMLTSAKCRGAESWLREILTPDVDRPWGLTPSPMPDLPPPVRDAIVMSVVEMALAAGWEINDARIDEKLLTIKTLAFRRMNELAKKIAERHENKIADQFNAGGWPQAVSDLIYDLVTFPACIIKGPVIRKKKAKKWKQGPNGQWIAVVSDELRNEWNRRSPFDIYPAPAMRDMQNGNLIDRYRFTREDLNSLIGVPGYDSDAIRQIITQYGEHGFRSAMVNDLERARLEGRENEWYDPEGTIEALDFWGSVSGHKLMEWGYKTGIDPGEGERLVATKEYQVEVWKTGGIVFKAKLNPDPMGRKPYDKACLEEIPGVFWGLGIPDLMSDCQRMCNGAARAVANNAAIASGPQVEIYVDRLADGEKVTKPTPWRVWQMTNDMTGANQRAIEFFQPQMNVQELLVIYQHFERVADNVTGFPNYSYGDSKVGGAGRTSSGLAQLLGNVGKGVRRVIQAFDRGIIKPQVTAIYDWNMQYDPDPSIKFDLQAEARGTAAMLIKDTESLRRREWLQATLNPLDAQIIGVEGRAQMLKEGLKSADFQVDKIIPDQLELELRKAGMPPMHELLGKTGPNAESSPGMGGGGGTPEGQETTDLAGQPPQGMAIREATQGYRHGGVIRRRNYDDLDNGV